MNLLRLFLLLFILSSLTGCAYLHSLDSDLGKQIDSWIEQEEYGKALDALYYIQSDHRDYALLMKKKALVQKRAAQFERNTLAKGERLLAEQDWPAALETYDAGLDKLPRSRPLQKARKRFLAQRARELNQLEIQMLKNKTDWLLNNARLHEQRLQIIPNNRTARSLARDHAREVDDTATALVDCIKEALDKGELQMGQQCLHIAKRLKPANDIQLSLAHAEQQLNREIKSRSRKLSRQGRQALRNARLALTEGDFIQAQALIDKLPLTDGKNQQVVSFRQELDEAIADHVETHIVEGQKLYSDGKIEQAHTLWQSLKPLSPQHEQLDELIARAERVLKKLQQINEQQEKTTTETGE